MLITVIYWLSGGTFIPAQPLYVYVVVVSILYVYLNLVTVDAEKKKISSFISN